MLDKSHVKETKGFTFISKAIYQDTTLSLKAKGLLSILFSLDEGFDVTIPGLCSFSTDKTACVSDGLKELEEHCYLIRKQQNHGKFASTDYIPFPEPFNEEQKEEIFKELKVKGGAANIRVKANDYTHISNHHLKYDKNISYEAKGLLSYLLSYPTDWEFNIRNISKRNGNGVDSVGNIILELKLNGYISVEQEKNSDTGLFGKIVYTVYDIPKAEVTQNFISTEYPKLSAEKKKRVQSFLKKMKTPICEIPYTDNPNTVIPSTGSENTEIQHTEFPRSENSVQYNNIPRNNIPCNNISCDNISSSSSKKSKKDLEADRYFKEEMKKTIKNELNYDWLVKRSYKAWKDVENDILTDRDEIDKLTIREDILDKIVDFIADLYAYPEREYTISGESYSAEDLKERYEGEAYNFKPWTVKNWVDTLKDKSIKNKRNYFYSMLVNG